MKTLLDGVNEILKRTGVISGESGELTSLTNSARQRPIDVAVQAINEGIDELYSATSTPHPNEQAEDTITLLDGVRSYALAADLVQLRFPLIDRTNNQHLFKFPGGYNAILVFDPELDDTGLPHWAAISPVNGELFLDRAPNSVEAGRIYTYQYDRDVSLTLATDEVSFRDAVFRAMVPAWVQLWKREMRNEFDGDLWESSIGRAGRFLRQLQPKDNWFPR